jgi:hypothetical protein
MRPTIVLVHGAFAESASWRGDPLALDPLGPIGIGQIANAYSASGPLALDPLAPVDSGARPIDAHGSDSEHTSEGMT